ncbi:MAG: hypothetical protein AB7G13_20305 [Lautropia sp.]
MSDTGTLQRLFRYKATADERTLAALQRLDGASPAAEVALRILGHAYVVDRIFAAHMTREERATAASISMADRSATTIGRRI